MDGEERGKGRVCRLCCCCDDLAEGVSSLSLSSSLSVPVCVAAVT